MEENEWGDDWIFDQSGAPPAEQAAWFASGLVVGAVMENTFNIENKCARNVAITIESAFFVGWNIYRYTDN